MVGSERAPAIALAMLVLLNASCKGVSKPEPPQPLPRSTQFVLDLTRSVEQQFEDLLAKSKGAFLSLKGGKQYDVFFLTGSSAQMILARTGTVPDGLIEALKHDNDWSDIEQRARGIFRNERDGYSCLVDSVFERVRALSAGKKDTRITLIYFTDGMEDCPHRSGNEPPWRVRLDRIDTPEQAVQMLSSDKVFAAPEKQAIGRIRLIYCLNANNLTDKPGVKSTQWLRSFWEGAFKRMGAEWMEFLVVDNVDEAMLEGPK